MDGRKIYWPRGRVLGGSSSINGLIAIRGQREDYNRWRDLGNPGWGFSDVLPYFLKSECNGHLSETQQHGTSGPVRVSSIPAKHELIEAAIAAAGRLGVPKTDDFNGERQEGLGYYQLTTYRGWRSSAVGAYLAPAKHRSSLKILTGAQVTRILFDGKRATGVSYVRGGELCEIGARRGVILSAGAVQSPQLLMLSGIGAADELQKYGIAPLIDRPSVGQNLHDHLQFRLVYRCTKPITINDALRSIFGMAKIGLQWLISRTRPLAIGINQGGLFTSRKHRTFSFTSRHFPQIWRAGSRIRSLDLHCPCVSFGQRAGALFRWPPPIRSHRHAFMQTICPPRLTGAAPLRRLHTRVGSRKHPPYRATLRKRSCQALPLKQVLTFWPSHANTVQRFSTRPGRAVWGAAKALSLITGCGFWGPKAFG